MPRLVISSLVRGGDVNRFYIVILAIMFCSGLALAQFNGSGIGVSGFNNNAPSSAPPATSVMITEDDNPMLTEDGKHMVVE